MHVLVVDDDELTRELLTLLLGAEGHRIESAASGSEALAKLDQITPDVILTDIQMPGIGGEALGKALRAAMPNGTLLLAMSGSEPPSQALRSYEGFLLKPFAMDDLQAKIVALRVTANGANLNRQNTAALVECELEESEAPAGGVPVLNEDVYAKLSDSMPAEQLGQMFTMCLEDARMRIGLMVELAAAEDDVKYRSTAHAIKGGCGFIGATELYCLAERAEQDGLRAESGTKLGTNRTEALLQELVSACERLERILKKRGDQRPVDQIGF